MAMPGAGALMYHSAQSPRSSRPSTPVASAKPPENPFDFTVPSFRPNLANFGRKITQIRDDIWAEIGEVDSTESAANPGFHRYGPPSGPSQSLPKKPATGEDVPGMGDDPVMCPFCDKPLPPSVFLSHKHQSRGQQLARPNPVKRTATTGGLHRSHLRPASSDGVTPPSFVSASPAKPALGVGASATTPTSPSQRSTTVDLPSKAHTGPEPKSTGVNPNELQAPVAHAAAATSSSTGLTDEDFKRWYALAGLPPPAPTPSSRSSSIVVGEKPIPKLAPPPPAGPASTSSRFTIGQDKSDESDDDTGGGTGYSKITGNASDTDEEKEEVIRDEPEEIKQDAGSTAELDKDSAVESPTPPASDLQIVLREVLGKLKEMSKTQNELRLSQSSLLTSLKIARSNLAMSEANTEMLESQLKQATAKALSPNSPVVPQSPQIGTSPVVSTAASAARSIPGRTSDEKARPLSIQMPGTTASSAPDKSSSWGFWSNNGKKRMPGGLNIALPSPSLLSSGEKTAFDFTGGVPYSSIPPQAPPGYKPGRSAESARDAPGPISSSEIAQLRQSHKDTQAKMQAMSSELAELKKGKLDMEAELENLSQALFEEANKMVAEERRKRAEVEESLKSIKDEKEALKATVKVLGGAVEDEADATNDTATKAVDKGAETVDETDFAPRDLDKHYAALRKSIHHVADGAEATPVFVPPTVATIQEEAAPEATQTAETSDSTQTSSSKEQIKQEGDLQSSISPNLPPPTEPNPWATAPNPV